MGRGRGEPNAKIRGGASGRGAYVCIYMVGMRAMYTHACSHTKPRVAAISSRPLPSGQRTPKTKFHLQRRCFHIRYIDFNNRCIPTDRPTQVQLSWEAPGRAKKVKVKRAVRLSLCFETVTGYSVQGALPLLSLPELSCTMACLR